MSVAISLIIALIVLGVLWWAAQRILAVVPIAEPFKTVIYVVIVVAAVFIVLDLLVGAASSGIGFHTWRMCP